MGKEMFFENYVKKLSSLKCCQKLIFNNILLIPVYIFFPKLLPCFENYLKIVNNAF